VHVNAPLVDDNADRYWGCRALRRLFTTGLLAEPLRSSIVSHRHRLLGSTLMKGAAMKLNDEYRRSRERETCSKEL
jgi:hypothetical protein